MQVFIFPNLDKKNCEKTVCSTYKFLTEHGVRVYMSEFYEADFSNLSGVTFEDENFCAEKCDIIIAIGGDGTILSASSLACAYNKKLLGINCGRLGFMATLEHDELYLLENLLNGNYHTESRHMLDVLVKRKDSSDSISVLNDIVISKTAKTKIADFKVKKSDCCVSHLRADGLIFSTPTGATAYSLSAGGPILEPDMDCFEFTPICPHTLMSRTMIFSKNTSLEVSFDTYDGNEQSLCLIADGNELDTISASDRVYISMSDKYIELIDIRGGNFFMSVTNKLMRPLKSSEEE